MATLERHPADKVLHLAVDDFHDAGRALLDRHSQALRQFADDRARGLAVDPSA